MGRQKIVEQTAAGISWVQYVTMYYN